MFMVSRDVFQRIQLCTGTTWIAGIWDTSSVFIKLYLYIYVRTYNCVLNNKFLYYSDFYDIEIHFYGQVVFLILSSPIHSVVQI